MYLSSVQPDMMRFFMLDADVNDCVVVVLYYLNPNRIDVYLHGGVQNVLPTNGIRENGVFKLLNDDGVDYIPTCASDAGSNYIDRNARLLYFVLKGTEEVVLKRANVVLVSFGLPAMSESDFYDSNLIENLAAMLNIPLNRVRVVEIISESSTGRRKRRNTDSTTVILEIGEDPAPSK